LVLIPDTPDPARRENQTRAAVFDQNGVFAIEAIPPGSYKLYAFEDVPEDIWLEPGFLKEIEDSGAVFHAKNGDEGFIQAPLLDKKLTDRALAKLGFEP
jgi:hypothetical protein